MASSVQRTSRTLHRWMGPPFVLSALLSLIFTGAGGNEESFVFLLLGVVLIGSLLVMVLTGSVMWIQHYRPSRRRANAASTLAVRSD
jgi:hypothetical protein